jgi:glycosyltransferase involved in cell wall biosynthesis
MANLRVAIVHYWFVARRGGERVVEALGGMFPQADFYTLVLDRNTLSPALQNRSFTTSFLQNLPGSKHYYRKLLPLFPLALEQFRLDDYDLVISSESGPAKGVLTRSGTCHICYCHTPMRYLWDVYHRYRQASGRISRAVFSVAANYMRTWDLATASRVDYFIANSDNVASRIRKHYRREAKVINPPVDVASGYISDVLEDYYLVVSQLVDYKRIDLAIQACNRLQRPLRIIGDGEQYKQLRRLAGRTIQFLGSLPDEGVHENYARCRALLFPGEEDFGIVPVEAQSFGRPVIAYGRGGALETVRGEFAEESDDPASSTGIFFREQSVASLVSAIQAFEQVESRFSPGFVRAQVARFGIERFKAEMARFVAEKLAEFSGPATCIEPIPAHFSSQNRNTT